MIWGYHYFRKHPFRSTTLYQLVENGIWIIGSCCVSIKKSIFQQTNKPPNQQMSHCQKTRPYFPLNTGWFIGIHISWFIIIPINLGSISSPLYSKQPGALFFIAQMVCAVFEALRFRMSSWIISCVSSCASPAASWGSKFQWLRWTCNKTYPWKSNMQRMCEETAEKYRQHQTSSHYNPWNLPFRPWKEAWPQKEIHLPTMDFQGAKMLVSGRG